MDFRAIWKRIVPYAALPDREVDRAAPDATATLAADLAAFAAGRPLLVDSALVAPRPRRYDSVAAVFRDHARSVELVAGFEDGSWWAVTEEEYSWYVYRSAAGARPDDP